MTPGPYSVRKDGSNGAHVVGINGVIIAWCGTNATYGSNGNSHAISAKEAHSNAQFICEQMNDHHYW
jgi:hypothetical protein